MSEKKPAGKRVVRGVLLGVGLTVLVVGGVAGYQWYSGAFKTVSMPPLPPKKKQAALTSGQASDIADAAPMPVPAPSDPAPTPTPSDPAPSDPAPVPAPSDPAPAPSDPAPVPTDPSAVPVPTDPSAVPAPTDPSAAPAAGTAPAVTPPPIPGVIPPSNPGGTPLTIDPSGVPGDAAPAPAPSDPPPAPVPAPQSAEAPPTSTTAAPVAYAGAEGAGPAGIKVVCKAEGRYQVWLDGQDTGQICPTERLHVKLGAHTIETIDKNTGEKRSFAVTVEETRVSKRVKVD